MLTINRKYGTILLMKGNEHIGKSDITTIFPRLLSILEVIPAFSAPPGEEEDIGVSSSEIHSHLKDQCGIVVDLRTVQRDLEALQEIFQREELKGVGKLDSHGGPGKRWYWIPGSRFIQIPAMGIEATVALGISQRLLQGVLPESFLQQLRPYAEHYQHVMERWEKDAAKTHLDWLHRIIVRQRGTIDREPAVVDAAIYEAIYAAFSKGKSLWIEYRSSVNDALLRGPVDPLGLVIAQGVTYLVGSFHPSGVRRRGEKPNPRTFSLQRIRKVIVQREDADPRPEFDLSAFWKEYTLPSPTETGPEMLPIHLRFTRQAGVNVVERKLSKDQQETFLTIDGVAYKEVQATVRNTQELRWWLQGFGLDVEVLGPPTLRAEFSDMAQKLAARYSKDASGGSADA